MKKSLIAIALAAMMAPAWGAEVVSSNIVGYEKITLTPGLNMIGNQFLAVGEDSFQNINQMFNNDSGINAGAGDGEADTILTWNGKSYNHTYYYDDYDNKWYDVAEDDPTEVVVNPGQGFWYKNIGKDNVDVTFAGEVPTNSVFSVNVAAGLNFIANPYPMSICPNSENFTVAGALAGAGDGEADTILTWNGKSYNHTYYLDDYDNKWYDTSEDDPVSDNIIKPAMGFWYKHLGNGATITFKKPY